MGEGSGERRQFTERGEYDGDGLPLDAMAWWETHEKQRLSLDALARRLRAAGRTLDSLEVVCARDAVEVLQALHTEVRGHLYDKQHQIDSGLVSVPNLADRMLYEAAGLPPATYDEAAHMAWIEDVKACGERDRHKGCAEDGCLCSCHHYTREQLFEDIFMVLTVYDEHVPEEDRGPWRHRLMELVTQGDSIPVREADRDAANSEASGRTERT